MSTIADGFSELLQNIRRADATRVRVTLVGSGGDLAVSVTDDGPGITDPGVLLPALEAGRPLDATRCARLRPAPLGRCGRRLGLEGRLGGGTVLFVRRCGCAMRRQAGAREEGYRRMLDAVAALEPSQKRDLWLDFRSI